MKAHYLLFTLLVSSTAAFAQSLEKSFNSMMAEFKKNPYTYAQASFAPDIRFTAGHNGEFMDVKKWITPAMKIEDIQMTDLKFFESGDLGVVSGINTTRYANPNGAPPTFRDAFTYTYKKQNTQWKVVAMQQTKVAYDQPGQIKTDEIAIKAALEGHSQACLDNDVSKAIGYYANSPNVAVAFTDLGYPRGYEAVASGYRKEFAGGKKSPNKLTTDDYRFNIVGNTAFVTYIETETTPDSKINKTHKANYLEKENGQWKMIGNFWIPETKP